jgi:uncharacterized small protein (DUF1192 family)
VHEIGASLDGLSVEELEARIVVLEEELVRLRAAVEARGSTRKAADAAFKF